MRHLILCLLFSFPSVALTGAEDPPVSADKAASECIAYLEKVLAQSKDAGEEAKIRAMIAAVKEANNPQPKIQNHLISDLADRLGQYKDQTLTLKLKCKAGAPGGLRTLVNPNGKTTGGRCMFEGIDPKNNAKLLIMMNFPKSMEVPAAKEDEELVITFVCGEGKIDKGNVVTDIRRP